MQIQDVEASMQCFTRQVGTNAGRRAAAVLVFLWLQPFSGCRAQEDADGWLYAWPLFSTAPTPEEACRRIDRILKDEFLYAAPALISGVWSGLIYDCTYRLALTGTTFRLSTSLHCSGGKIPAWPGVCTRPVRRQPKKPPACSSNDPSYTVGNPVSVTLGAKVEDAVDFLWGPSALHRIVRSYRSIREAMPGSAGHQLWSFSFDRGFDVTQPASASRPSTITITDSYGNTDVYKPEADNYRSATSGGVLKPLSSDHAKWAHLQPDGMLDVYEKVDNEFRLTSSHTSAGMEISYAYDQSNRLSQIMDTFNRTVDLRWTAEGNLATIQNATSISAYEHEAVGGETQLRNLYRLRSVSRQSADKQELASTRYHYLDGSTWQSRFLLSGIEHEPGVQFAQFSYDDEGRVLSSEHAGGAYRFTFAYPNWSSTVVTDPLGAVRTYTYDEVNWRDRITEISQPGGSGCAPAARKFTYDLEGNLVSLVKFNGQKTCFANHATRGLEITRVEGLNDTERCPAASVAPSAGQRKISTRWHPVWDVKTGIAEPLKITSYIYNGQPDRDGKILQCAGNGKLPDGSPVAVICKRIEQATTDQSGGQGFAAAANGAARVTTYTYNAFGQMLSSAEFVGPGRSNTTRYEYYADTSPSHTMGDLWKVADPDGQVTEYLEYTTSGVPTKIRTPQGAVTERSYDVLQRLTRHVTAAGTPGARTTDFSYNAAGLLIRVDLPDSSSLAYSYDQAERLTAITDKQGNSIQYTLDSMGNRIREETRDASGTLTRQVTRVYDVLNRLQDSRENSK
ncbi:hypothetical protein [Massilia endophytica]|uniref:hypothetical protein n=1 Tax=Massilia endophytica TaxID=2899220 RepID=UPI001E583F13|nr:hypothetical protein [Massilia endophytica]UGQ47858.1 hypothetical protein LSQ66_05150 [Massilia endophytica]